MGLRAYWEVTKPRTWLLLVFTAVGGMLVAAGGRIYPYHFTLGILAVTLGCMGANTLTCYLDRDIDAVMVRTRMRPLPAGRIKPASKALYYGLALSASSLTLAYMVKPLASLLMLLGLLDNVVVYSMILKRRNPVNIIVGGFSGGMPTLIGWVVVPEPAKPILTAVLMAALVVLWIPSHIWSLALRYRDDYMAARVPMLPVVVSERAAVRCIASTSILLVAFSILLNLLGYFGALYLYVSIALGTVMLYLSMKLFRKPSKEMAWRLFKFTSPYLALIFTAMILDVYITGAWI